VLRLPLSAEANSVCGAEGDRRQATAQPLVDEVKKAADKSAFPLAGREALSKRNGVTFAAERLGGKHADAVAIPTQSQCRRSRGAAEDKRRTVVLIPPAGPSPSARGGPCRPFSAFQTIRRMVWLACGDRLRTPFDSHHPLQRKKPPQSGDCVWNLNPAFRRS